MIGYVYSLNDNKNIPFYVGCTTTEIENRLALHKSCLKINNSPVYKFIRSNNIVPTIELIEIADVPNKKALLKLESYWISQLVSWGFDLLNSVGNPSLKDTGTSLVEEKYEVVKINKSIIDKVRKNKAVTGVPVGTFFEQAATEKLNKKTKKDDA